MDGRVTWIALTSKGTRKINQAVTRHCALLRVRVLAVLGAADFEKLGTIMRTLRDSVGSDTAAA